MRGATGRGIGHVTGVVSLIGKKASHTGGDLVPGPDGTEAEAVRCH